MRGGGSLLSEQTKDLVISNSRGLSSDLYGLEICHLRMDWNVMMKVICPPWTGIKPWTVVSAQNLPMRSEKSVMALKARPSRSNQLS